MIYLQDFLAFMGNVKPTITQLNNKITLNFLTLDTAELWKIYFINKFPIYNKELKLMKTHVISILSGSKNWDLSFDVHNHKVIKIPSEIQFYERALCLKKIKFQSCGFLFYCTFVFFWFSLIQQFFDKQRWT